jgi:hypothetical protein
MHQGARPVRISDFSRYAISICAAAAFLAGCSGSQPPIGAPGAMPQTKALQSQGAQREDRDGSWMSPNTQAQDLLYVTNYSYVSVYSYPQGGPVGTLTGFRSTVGACVDSKGDVFITNHIYKHGNTRIAEYAHGGSQPILELANDKHIGPLGCSVDPITGNLAVSGGGSRYAGVDIFQGAKGKPLFVKIPQMVFTGFCGYDNRGNLFVNGIKDFSGTAAFVELSRGSQKFVSIKLNAVYDPEGGVQWDGKHLAVGGYIPPGVSNAMPVIYRFAINGKRGTKVGTTTLGRPAEFTSYQFFITGDTAIVPNRNDALRRAHDVLFYNYPQGGSPTKIITKRISDPRGAAVSFASADR